MRQQARLWGRQHIQGANSGRRDAHLRGTCTSVPKSSACRCMFCIYPAIYILQDVSEDMKEVMTEHMATAQQQVKTVGKRAAKQVKGVGRALGELPGRIFQTASGGVGDLPPNKRRHARHLSDPQVRCASYPRQSAFAPQRTGKVLSCTVCSRDWVQYAAHRTRIGVCPRRCSGFGATCRWC